ncbi:conserved hypothetical protein [Methylomarinovum caldicuralii]|uniref:Uncharacterized protein n=1 Tax=Methylomarinovum caldicuralii TaxID=438856 RepID=A0AAU9C324_9GAMM|nr:DUF99 family protein [Methylomarinovum caldicuralii]BCX81534.1 conserved hypothetical protein [Methylomarinovum caldicuralii]
MTIPTHIAGFDDMPFPPGHRGDVGVIGTVFTAARLDGVLLTKIRRDGANSTRRIAAAIRDSRFHGHLQLVMLQGIALAGFNVVDIWELHRETGLPVLVVCRKRPDYAAIRRALLTRVPGGKRKWRLIQRAGDMEALEGIYVQRAGLAQETAAAVIRATAIHSRIPEPLRTSHIIATGLSPWGGRQRV